MIINKIIGNIKDLDITKRAVERVFLHWDETGKRMLRKRTDKGTEIGICLEKNEHLKDGDVIYHDEGRVIVIEILPVELIMIEPESMLEMGHICYLLGNRHLTVFIEDNTIFTPYEPILWEYLKKFNFKIKKIERKVSNALQLSGEHH